MAIVYRTAFVKNVTAPVDELVIFGIRGGVMLEMNLKWVPHSYIDKGLETEQFRHGDIHCLLLDASTNRSPIGQANLTLPNADAIVIPTGGTWSWTHPEIGFLIDTNLVGRMTFNPSAITDPIGVIRGSLILRLYADTRKTPLVGHSVAVESKFLAFDTAYN